MPSQPHSTHPMTDKVRSCRRKLSTATCAKPGGILYPLLHNILVSMGRLAPEMEKHIMRVSSGRYSPEELASAFQPAVLERSQRILAAIEQSNEIANDKHRGSEEARTAVVDVAKCYKKLADQGMKDRDALQSALEESYRRKCEAAGAYGK